MPQRSGLDEFQEAKRLLIVQSEIHRNLLRVGAADLREHGRRLLPSYWLAGAGRGRLPVTWTLAGAALAGLITVRHWRKLLRWAPLLLKVWGWWRRRR